MSRNKGGRRIKSGRPNRSISRSKNREKQSCRNRRSGKTNRSISREKQSCRNKKSRRSRSHRKSKRRLSYDV